MLRPQPTALRSTLLASLICINSVTAAATAADGASSSASNPQTETKPASGKTNERVIPFEVTVNGAKSGTWLFIEHGEQLYAPHDAFEEWRVQLDTTAKPITFKGEPYWPLSAVPGFEAKVNFSNQSLDLLFSPQAFAATRLTKPAVKRAAVSPVLPSVFFNYDLNYNRSYLTRAPNTEDLGLLSELGFSSGLGVLTSSSIGRNLTDDRTLGNEREFIRLETTFTKDFADQNRTLRLGDAYTKTSMQGRNIYFGGIQYGSNFALTPGFVSQPLPVLNGLSSTPSTVELYVNDVLRQVSDIPAGPFAIDNFPTLTGSGDARIVVRDLLGRETVIQQSFVTSSQLLSTGLDDWSIEAGKVRRNLGSSNATYGPEFASGIWRHGYNNSMTLEGRAELTPDLQHLQLGMVTALPWYLLGRASLGNSQFDDIGSGQQWLLGIEQQGLRHSATLEFQGASENFRQLGQESDILPTKLQIAGNVSYASQDYGTYGLGFASIDRYDSPRVTTISANYSRRVGKHSNLAITASRVESDNDISNAVALSLVIPLDNNRVVSAYASNRGTQNDFYMTAAQNPGLDNDFGWRVLAGQQQNHNREEAGVTYLGRYGNVTGDVSTTSDQTALRLGANGGLVMADGHLFATRQVDDSFAVAEVAGYGNVGIGLGSNVLTHTDSSGIALIPRMMAYQNNSVRLDPRELPISAEIDSIEQIVVPPYRSAVKVVFPVRTGRGALLKIILDDGEVAPAGAIVQIKDDKEEFYVARRGEAFVTGLQQTNSLMLNWKNQQCVFEVTLPPESPDEMPRVGPLLCKGVTR